MNQIVYPGDILVDNVLIDAFGKPQSVYVEGQVWGKTWTTISSELHVDEPYTVFEPFHFLRLLYDCRTKIEKEIGEKEQVLSEKILQLTQDGSTFTIKVHYTCLEMISGQ